jgi:PAS domain-containing protein
LGIVVANTDGQVIWLNESAGELLNLAAPQLAGTPIRRMYDAVFTRDT